MNNSNSLKFTDMVVELTFKDEFLGTLPGDPEVYAQYVASKAPDAPTIQQEIEEFGVDETYEKGITVFARNEEENPCLFNYVIKGQFKNACSILRSCPNTASKKLTAFKKKIDGGIFIEPRKIPIEFDGKIEICERPLRASTPQGERVALAASEMIKPGAKLKFIIKVLDPAMIPLITEWLDYGAYNGLGQWHNSGKGRFDWKDITNDEDGASLLKKSKSK